MPVLDTERRSTRSALRYRPIDTDQARPAPAISRARRQRPDARMTTAPAAPDDLDFEEEEQAPGRRPVAPRRPPPARTRRRVHPLLLVGLGLVAMILLWAGSNQAVSWSNDELNTLRYGNPRITQMDAQIGGDTSASPSHLLALNLYGTIIVEVFPGGDASRLKTYTLTTLGGPGSAQDVVTLRLIDPDHTGRPDLVVIVGDMASFLVQDQQGNFRAPTPAEQQQLRIYLQQHP